VIIQRVREAEKTTKSNTFNEYKDSKGELITGIVRRFERGNIIVDIGRPRRSCGAASRLTRES